MLTASSNKDDVNTPMLTAKGGNSSEYVVAAICDKDEETIADQVATHQQPDPDRIKNQPRKSMTLFERASTNWWNPQFESTLLESQYWQCSFPRQCSRFRSGLLYMGICCIVWFVFNSLMSVSNQVLSYQATSVILLLLVLVILGFTFRTSIYQRFYLPTSFLCAFFISIASLLAFSLSDQPLISPLGTFSTSIEIVMLIYTVIPLPLYLCIIGGAIYSGLFQVLSMHSGHLYELNGITLALHFTVHLLGIHLFILTQVRQRRTFLKIGQSLLARKDLEIETHFKDHMIQSVMPKSVAEELLKEAGEIRRSSIMTGNLEINSVDSKNREPTVRKFRPFTMNLMTDVSILFADIAGFTQMSANKSADELVNLLNDLFGRFDILCGKYNMEKISTLGDCYYCVAGCPEPHPDHAICCVEMGLAMIVAIKQFDQDRGQDVNMRVGIHTGKVMCGMVGMKRFKFDVFSNDVTFANEMESTGMAGRVHISEKTAEFLQSQYELDEGAESNGVRTYFIKEKTADVARVNIEPDESAKGSIDSNKTPQSEPVGSGLCQHRQMSFRKKLANKLKTIQSSSASVGRGGEWTPTSIGGSLRMKLMDREKNISLDLGGRLECEHKSASLQALCSGVDMVSIRGSFRVKTSRELANGGSSGGGKGSHSSCLMEGFEHNSIGGYDLDTVISHHHNAASITRFDTDNREFDRRLANVIQNSEFGKVSQYWIHGDSLSAWTLRFKDAKVEKRYRAHFGKLADRNTDGADVDEAKYRYSAVFVDILVAGVVFVVVAAVVATVFGTTHLGWLVFFPLALLLVVLSFILVGLPLLRRLPLLPFVNDWVPRHVLGLLLMALPIGAALCNVSSTDSNGAQLVAGYILVLGIFCHCNFSQLSCWSKTLQAGAFGLVLILLTNSCFDTDFICPLSSNASSASDFDVPLFSRQQIYRWETIVDVLLALILIAFLNYYVESSFRLSFYGDLQACQDTEQMQLVRDQADWLLTNIIPQHAVDELRTNTKYSQNHPLTAVLFASITNWNEMYEENFEDGREFLRVLNEVIGDFDELLDRPQFSQVQKIKTIGSTYMVASGLDPDRRRLSLHPYEHLYQLIEFSLALQETLANFNQDLLNFDFVCKLGFNIGSVTAGVIGTTKSAVFEHFSLNMTIMQLYYDIWGDTVNISSRMYSTGLTNRLQVSQATRDLLCDRYDFEFRDHIEVKGIEGGMDTYLLVGRKGEAPINFNKIGK